MEHNKGSVPILLGRPFLKIACAMINVATGSLTLEIDGNTFHINIYEAMKHSSREKFAYALDLIEPVV